MEPSFRANSNQNNLMSQTSIWNRSWRILPWKPLHPGEGMLAWGLLFLCGAVAMLHFVMGFFFALPLAGVALIFLINGIQRAAAKDNSKPHAAAGIALLLVGFAALGATAFAGASLSYKLALETQMPQFAAKHYPPVTFSNFVLLCLASALPLVFLSPGLNLCTNWSARRQKIWKIIFVATPFVALVVHQFLAAAGGPLTA